MAKLHMQSTYVMPSGHSIPVLGFGVYKTPAAECEGVVLHALKTGYRHIDSAAAYHNEGPCANAIRKSGIPREEIFFTSKIPPGEIGYKQAKTQVAKSLAETGLDYIDLILIHAPYGDSGARNDTWLALREAQQAGQVRSIGVSNYGVHHLDELEAYIKSLDAKNGKGAGGRIDVGQYELHPWLMRQDIVDWLKKRGVVVEAYSPIVRNERAGDKQLKLLADKYGKTETQVLLRWSLQRGFVPLPKSVNKTRIEQNADLFGWEMEDADVKALDTDEYSPCAWDPTIRRD